jgi:hypothetical protein
MVDLNSWSDALAKLMSILVELGPRLGARQSLVGSILPPRASLPSSCPMIFVVIYRARLRALAEDCCSYASLAVLFTRWLANWRKLGAFAVVPRDRREASAATSNNPNDRRGV